MGMIRAWIIIVALAQLAEWLPATNATLSPSFLNDVVWNNDARDNQLRTRNSVEDALLMKAVPLDTYKSQLQARGLTFNDETRRLEDADAGDDYYLDADNMYSFSGYSLKYAKCQPIQKFSEDAVKSGEHTPMVTEDIVILRLCPTRFCLSSRTYGCQYNFAEYAIGLSDYVRVMIRYREDRTEKMCEWCNSCDGNGRRRKLEADGGQGEGEGEQNQGEEEGQDDRDGDNEGQGGEDDGDQDAGQDGQEGGGDDGNDGDDYYQADDDDDGAGAGNDDASAYGDDAVDENGGCTDYDAYCLDGDGARVCADSDDDAYLDVLDYLDYLDCTKITDNDNYNYYVRPRCDGTQGTIKMAVYHDAFCSQYAGNDVSLKNFGLGFRESIFEEFYKSSTCISCSESNYPPYYNANSNMCNRMHVAGGVCTDNMQYDLFGQVDDDSTVCSFIESVRFDTYDAYGRLQIDSSSQSNSRTVTEGQKFGLAFSIFLCAILAIYSCYLHHSITNLLIKSLSHTDLLPPSRHKSARSVRSSRSKSSRRSRKTSPTPEEDADWDVRGVPA